MLLRKKLIVVLDGIACYLPNFMKLPRNNKNTVWEDYSNKEVRTSIEWSRKYFNKPEILCVFHPCIFINWLYYKQRLEKSGREPNYNYWLICYAFGI